MSVVLNIILAISGLGGVLVALAAFNHTRGSTKAVKTHDEIAGMIARASEPAARDIAALKAEVARVDSRCERIDGVADRVGVLETKIDVFWKNVAFDAARILHQPDPDRHKLDVLLEKFQAGTLTAADMRTLKVLLISVRDHKDDNPSEHVPVFPGDQIAAAIMLRVMENMNVR